MEEYSVLDILERIHNLTYHAKEVLVNDDVLIETDYFVSEGAYEYEQCKYNVYEKDELVFKGENVKHNTDYYIKFEKYIPGKWEKDIKDYCDMLEYNLEMEVSKQKTKTKK